MNRFPHVLFGYPVATGEVGDGPAVAVHEDRRPARLVGLQPVDVGAAGEEALRPADGEQDGEDGDADGEGARQPSRPVPARGKAIAGTRSVFHAWAMVSKRLATPHAQAAGPALHEFAVVIHRQDEPTHERTVWARCSVDVALDVLEDLQRDGCTRSHVQVKALGTTRRSHPQ